MFGLNFKAGVSPHIPSIQTSQKKKRKIIKTGRNFKCLSLSYFRAEKANRHENINQTEAMYENNKLYHRTHFLWNSENGNECCTIQMSYERERQALKQVHK